MCALHSEGFFLNVALWKQREYMNASPCFSNAIWFVYFCFYCLRKAPWFVCFILHNIKIAIWCLNLLLREFAERIFWYFTAAKITKTSQETRNFVKADFSFIFQSLEVHLWNTKSFLGLGLESSISRNKRSFFQRGFFFFKLGKSIPEI